MRRGTATELAAVVLIVTEMGEVGDVPFSVAEVGLKMQVAFAGNPLQPNVTVCVEPFCGVTVNVNGDVVPPAATLILLTDGPLIVKVGVVALTVCVSAGVEVLPLKFPSPLYCTVIESEPCGKADVINVAWPLLSVPMPIFVVVLSKNVTVPVGVPAPGAAAATVEVKVTD
jgi:hypothetical protein